MKIVQTTDDNGFRHSYLVRNASQPIDEGIEMSIPDLTEINWINFRKDLHNFLHDNQLFSKEDVTTQKGYRTLSFIIQKVFFEVIYKLYNK